MSSLNNITVVVPKVKLPNSNELVLPTVKLNVLSLFIYVISPFVNVLVNPSKPVISTGCTTFKANGMFTLDKCVWKTSPILLEKPRESILFQVLKIENFNLTVKVSDA